MITRLVALLTSTLLILAATVWPMSAQQRPTVYEGRSPLARCWNSNITCRINFSATPSTSRVLIKNVACYLQSNVTLRSLFLGVSASSGGTEIKVVPVPFGAPNSVATEGFLYYYSINSPVYFYIGPGRYPYLIVNASGAGVGDMFCAVAGELETP